MQAPTCWVGGLGITAQLVACALCSMQALANTAAVRFVVIVCDRAGEGREKHYTDRATLKPGPCTDVAVVPCCMCGDVAVSFVPAALCSARETDIRRPSCGALSFDACEMPSTLRDRWTHECAS